MKFESVLKINLFSFLIPVSARYYSAKSTKILPYNSRSLNVLVEADRRVNLSVCNYSRSRILIFYYDSTDVSTRLYEEQNYAYDSLLTT